MNQCDGARDNHNVTEQIKKLPETVICLSLSNADTFFGTRDKRVEALDVWTKTRCDFFMIWSRCFQKILFSNYEISIALGSFNGSASTKLEHIRCSSHLRVLRIKQPYRWFRAQQWTCTWYRKKERIRAKEDRAVLKEADLDTPSEASNEQISLARSVSDRSNSLPTGLHFTAGWTSSNFRTAP